MPESLLDYALREWTVIFHAPVAFGVCVVLAAVLIWLFERRMFQERQDTRRERIEFLGEQLAEYKSKLSGATPDQAAGEIESLKLSLERAHSQLSEIMPWITHQTSERHLTPEQRTKIVEGIRGFPPECIPFAYVGSIPEPEAQQFALEIMAALQAGNLCCHQKEPQAMTTFTPDERGVMIVIPNEHAPGPHAIVLMKALAGAGLDVKFDSFSANIGIDPRMVSICVGHKIWVKP